MSHHRKHILSVLLTTACNLRCTYCILGTNRGSAEHEIDLEFAKAGIDYFFETTSSRWIRFYGVGEPTMAFPKMVAIWDYARSRAGPALTVELQSNGTFAFSSEVRDWVIKHVDLNYVSFDGLPEIHDKYRVTRDGRPTSGPIIENIRHLLARDRFVAVRATVGAELLHRQREMIDFLAALGIRYVFSKNLLPAVDACVSCKGVDAMDYARAFVEAYRYAAANGVFYSNCYVSGFDEKGICYCRQAIPAPHLTPDGVVSSCDRACCAATPLSDLIYGRFDPEKNALVIDENRVRRIRSRQLENLSRCRECDVGPYCCGSCTGTAYQMTGDPFGIAEEYCEAIRFMYKEMAWKGGFFPCFHP